MEIGQAYAITAHLTASGRLSKEVAISKLQQFDDGVIRGNKRFREALETIANYQVESTPTKKMPMIEIVLSKIDDIEEELRTLREMVIRIKQGGN